MKTTIHLYFKQKTKQAILKYALSIDTGIALSFFGWWLNLTLELVGLQWYWVLAWGVVIGLVASGGYGFVKCFWSFLPGANKGNPSDDKY